MGAKVGAEDEATRSRPPIMKEGKWLPSIYWSWTRITPIRISGSYSASSSSADTLRNTACYNDPPRGLPPSVFVAVTTARLSRSIPPCNSQDGQPEGGTPYTASGMSNHLAVVAVLAATVVCGCTVDKVVGRYKSAVCKTVPATQASTPSAVEQVTVRLGLSHSQRLCGKYCYAA